MPIKTTIISVFSVLMLFNSAIHAQNHSFEWAKQIGGASDDIGNSITTDLHGNVYTTGRFYGSVDFDPGLGNSTFTSNGSSDIFIQKFNSNGTLIWAKHLGGTGYDEGLSISTDINGNVYSTGRFENTVDFGLGTGNTVFTSIGNDDVYIQKLDSSGNLIWAKQIGGINSEYGNSIVVDPNENVYTSGRFFDTVDFNPGTGTTSLSSLGSNDIFIQKLDVNGNFIWAKHFGGIGSDFSNSIALDKHNSVYSTGQFSNTVDFDPGPGVSNLTSNGMGDIYIQKLDSSGNFIWAKRMGGSADDQGFSLSIDVKGNIYTTGYFTNSVDFDPGTGVTNFVSNGFTDVFVQKLNSNGNLVWVKQIGGVSNDRVFANCVDANGDIYTMGTFALTVDFDPGPGIFNLTWATNSQPAFIQKLDSSGNFVWANRIKAADTTGFNGAIGHSLTSDILGNLYATGLFFGNVDFDPGPLVNNSIAVGAFDIFILKLTGVSLSTGINSLDQSDQLSIYPNPTEESVSIASDLFQGNLCLKLYSSSGKLLNVNNTRNLTSFDYKINQPKGMYILEISDELGNKWVQKLVKE